MRKKKKAKEPGHDGRVVNAFTWGTGEGGQLGYGLDAPISQDVPRPVFPIGAEVGRHVVRAAAGGRHSLFLLESSQVLACGVWDDGQLGCKDRPVVFVPGTSEEMAPLPKSLVPRGMETSPVPVKVPAKLVVKELAAGFASSFLLTDFGEVRALRQNISTCISCTDDVLRSMYNSAMLVLSMASFGRNHGFPKRWVVRFNLYQRCRVYRTFPTACNFFAPADMVVGKWKVRLSWFRRSRESMVSRPHPVFRREPTC